MVVVVHEAPAPRQAIDDLRSPDPSPQAPRSRSLLTPVLLGASTGAGVLLVALAFRLQTEGQAQTPTACVFWAGMLLGILPAARIIVRRGATRGETLVALVLLSGVTAAPRLLRATGPLFPDEYAAWRQTVDAVHGYSGALGGFVPGVEGYPGLHLLVGSIASVTGLSVAVSAAVLLTVAHVVGALAVFSVAETLLGRTRTAGVAALIYLLNPISLFVGMRMAPESLALPLVLTSVALAVLGCSSVGRGLRQGLTVAAAVLLVVVALTDGTVGLMALALFLLVLIGAVWRTRQHPMQLVLQPDGSVLRHPVGTPEFPVVWARLISVLGAAMVSVAVALAATGGAFEQVADWFPSRGLFGMSGRTPFFEVLLTAVAPLLVLLVAAEGVWRLWSQPRQRTGRLLALASVGALYFPLVPLVLLPTLGPAVRTAWGLTYLGVALLTAPVVLRRYDRLRLRDGWIVDRITAGPLVSLLLAVVLVGNSASAAGAGYRYAGPNRFGAEGRSDTAELRSIAAAFASQDGRRTGILADRYTGPAFAAFSGSRLARATTLLPGSELMQGVDPTLPEVTDLVRRGYTHLVVDMRMADMTPLDGDSFGPRDKGEGRQTRETALLRLDRVPWLSRVAASEHYRVYRLDLGGAGRPLVDQGDPWGPDYRPIASPPAPGLPASTAYPPPVLTTAADGVAAPSLPPAADTLPGTSTSTSTSTSRSARGLAGVGGAAGVAEGAHGSARSGSAGRSGVPVGPRAHKPVAPAKGHGKGTPASPGMGKPTSPGKSNGSGKPTSPGKSNGSGRAIPPGQAKRQDKPTPPGQAAHATSNPPGKENGHGPSSAPGQVKKSEGGR